jgi:hypothetical protein
MWVLKWRRYRIAVEVLSASSRTAFKKQAAKLL